ncbi:hypothetical protein LZ554_001790 [Drepanopeziza brunnea f. sp. 'monogermtubi']|nr:hypothetical protein LZ554_001790 [Drepanopeziza brunnea f. sp. 'monogermtubi']
MSTPPPPMTLLRPVLGLNLIGLRAALGILPRLPISDVKPIPLSVLENGLMFFMSGLKDGRAAFKVARRSLALFPPLLKRDSSRSEYPVSCWGLLGHRVLAVASRFGSGAEGSDSGLEASDGSGGAADVVTLGLRALF